MKNSNKIFAAMAIVATALFASCQKSEMPVENNQDETGHVVIYVSAPDASKVTTTDGATTLQVTGWKEGDKLNLYKVVTEDTKSVSSALVLTCTNASEGEGNAKFEGYRHDTDPLESELNYATTGTMKVVGKKIYVYPPKQASTKVEDVILLIGARDDQGKYAMTINGTILEITNNSGAAIDAAVKCGASTWSVCVPCVFYYDGAFYGKTEEKTNFADAKFTLATGKNYVFLHTGDESNYVGLCSATDEGDACSILAKNWFGTDNSPVAGTYFTATYPVEDSPLTKKTFKVSATKSVQFTKGNLYWDGTNWKLEDSQVEYPTTWSTSHVGHFYFAKSASNAYSQSYNECTSSTATSSDKLFCDGSDNDHMLTVGTIDGLYALSQPEWEYLINTRSRATDLRKDNVTVDGVSGCLVIAPDSFAGTLKASYTSAELNSDDLICLPISGCRDGSTMYPFSEQVPEGAYYMTTTIYADTYPFYTRALFIATGQVSTKDMSFQRSDCAVAIRLVK